MAKIDWECIHYAQKELCIKKRISITKFQEAWRRYFGEPQSDSDRYFLREGIELFYEDYLTSTTPDLSSYFKGIVSEEHITK